MGFLSKLFSHKSVEEVADEIANTYAEEVQAVTVEQTDTAGAETEQVNMLEVSDMGEIEYTEKAGRITTAGEYTDRRSERSP